MFHLLPPEISFLRIASNANLGGTSGRALFPSDRFLLKYIFRINHLYKQFQYQRNQWTRSFYWPGFVRIKFQHQSPLQVLTISAEELLLLVARLYCIFLALQTLHHYKRNNVYRDCQILCDLAIKLALPYLSCFPSRGCASF